MRDFTSAQWKLKHAYSHIEKFERERTAFLRSHPCTVRPQFNPNTRYTDYVVEHVDEVPTTLVLILGDAVHNLRAVLDHIAAALVRANGQTKTDIFPICDSESRFQDWGMRRIKRMSPADQERIRFIKPYLGGRDLLWALHQLDITDKHKLLITSIQCAGAVKHRFDQSSIMAALPVPEELIVPLLGPLPVAECGKVVASYPGNVELDQDVDLSFDVGFGKNVEVFGGRLVGESLTQMAKEVEGIYNAFERTAAF